MKHYTMAIINFEKLNLYLKLIVFAYKYSRKILFRDFSKKQNLYYLI